jgi:hypothetical protein
LCSETSYFREVPAMSGRRSESNDRVGSVVRSLLARFGTAVEAATIAAEVEAEFAVYYSKARVTDFVPIFVERSVGSRLRSRWRDGPRGGPEIVAFGSRWGSSAAPDRTDRMEAMT